MGLLDEAIRAHLDLRLRHGANPQEVAREEADALAPVEREPKAERSALADAPTDSGDRDRAAVEQAPFDGQRERIVGGGTQGRNERSSSSDSGFMEQTAEIDMRAVLGELEHGMSSEEDGNGDLGRAIRAGRAAPVAAGSARAGSDFEADEDPLVWETHSPRARRIERRGS